MLANDSAHCITRDQISVWKGFVVCNSISLGYINFQAYNDSVGIWEVKISSDSLEIGFYEHRIK